MEMTGDQLTNLMIDLCWLSLLLLIGKYLRTRFVFLQRLFLPASVIAGFIGLALGPYIFGNYLFTVIPQEMMNAWALYPGRLINVVFACLFLGFSVPSLKTIWKEGGPQLCYGWLVGMGQYMVGVGISVALLSPLFGVPSFFGCLLEIGFSGGHGTAAGMAEAFDQLGFAPGSDLGLMSATVGVISAVVFGMAMINMAARRGYTRVIKSPKDLSLSEMRGLIPPEERTHGSVFTISPNALEPFAFHAAFVGVAILIGWYMLKGIKNLSANMEPDLFKSFPLFPLAMLGGLFIQIFASKSGLSKYLDRQTFDRILGLALDFLVVSAIASIRLDVFFAYFLPFSILMIVGLVWVIFATWFIAPRMLPDAWFERGITEYGMQTGVTALGLLLLRVADPHFKTPAAKSFGFKQILYEPMLGGGFITAAAPILIYNYGVLTSYAIGFATILVALAVAFFNGWFHRFEK
ncbi:MAG: sodium:glutamate symporter [Candidatus Aminicenantes bacterium]|nr:sodium:glutamate symporter [Candidatus Aminicenantes bacterium]MDH5386052.1 sodium:glutamate symporter [Candidatus Aminicenantes bacterium]